MSSPFFPLCYQLGPANLCAPWLIHQAACPTHKHGFPWVTLLSKDGADRLTSSACSWDLVVSWLVFYLQLVFMDDVITLLMPNLRIHLLRVILVPDLSYSAAD